MRILGLSTIALLAALSCNKNNNLPSPAGQVSMLDFSFSPESLNISVGDTVTWVNKGAYDHTTTSGEAGIADGLWDSGNVAPGASYSRAFTAVGNFHYYCTPHFGTYGMKGVIAVRR